MDVSFSGRLKSKAEVTEFVTKTLSAHIEQSHYLVICNDITGMLSNNYIVLFDTSKHVVMYLAEMMHILDNTSEWGYIRGFNINVYDINNGELIEFFRISYNWLNNSHIACIVPEYSTELPYMINLRGEFQYLHFIYNGKATQSIRLYEMREADVPPQFSPISMIRLDNKFFSSLTEAIWALQATVRIYHNNNK